MDISSKSPASSYTNMDRFNYSSKPMFPLQNLSKITIDELGISLDGKSGGVIFIQSNRGSFVLKPTICAPSDFFYNQLALTLELNVPVMTIINCYDDQFKKVVFQIEKYALIDQVLSKRLQNKLDSPFYEIIEYIPNATLVSFGPHKFQKFISEEMYRLYTIGMVVGFDIVINNSDRIKCIWRGEGNINNILIEINTEHENLGKNWFQKAKQRENMSVPFDNFIFIDHDGSMPNPNDKQAGPNVEKYMEKVTTFQLNLVMYLRKEHSYLPEQFQKMTNYFKFFTKYEYSETEKTAICEGIIYLTKKFIMAFEAKQIHRLYQSMIRQTAQNKNRNQIYYWNDYWNKEFTRRVHLEFCELYYIKVSAIYTTYPELINQIYDRVDGVMKKWQDSRNKRKRVSNLGRLEKEDEQKREDFLEEENGKDSVRQSEKIQQFENEEKQNQKNRKRKWREKLTQFQQQNYK